MSGIRVVLTGGVDGVASPALLGRLHAEIDPVEVEPAEAGVETKWTIAPHDEAQLVECIDPSWKWTMEGVPAFPVEMTVVGLIAPSHGAEDFPAWFHGFNRDQGLTHVGEPVGGKGNIGMAKNE